MNDAQQYWIDRVIEGIRAFDYDRANLFQSLWDEGAPRWLLKNVDERMLESFEQRQKIDGYRIVCFLAEGGMGQVFECTDDDLGRTVLLKRPFPGIHCPANSALWPTSFPQAIHLDREARITAGFNHFGIVTILRRVKDNNGLEYYVMNPVNGETLSTHIQQLHSQLELNTKFSSRHQALRELLGRFATVCDIAAYMHEQGVLHRDLKPSNIMLGDFGRTFVIDFGLAQEVNQENSDGERVVRISCTPAYLAPECYEGIETFGRDVYALGAVLYEILTGQPPARTDQAEDSTSIRQGSYFIAKPRTLNRNVPRRLEAICLKALASDLDSRYGGRESHGVEQLAKDVRNWLADEPISAFADSSYDRAARVVRHNTRAFITATTLIAISALLVGFLYSSLIFQYGRANQSAKIASNTLQKVVLELGGPLILNPAARELHLVIMAESNKALDELMKLSPDLIVHSTRAELYLLQSANWNHEMKSERNEEKRKALKANRDRYFAKAVSEADLGLQKNEERSMPIWIRTQITKARLIQKDGDSARGLSVLRDLLNRLGKKPDPSNYKNWSKKEIDLVDGIDNAESNLAEALEEAKLPNEAVNVAMHVLDTPVKYQSADHKMAAATMIYFATPDDPFGHILALKAHQKTLSDIDKQVSAAVLRQDPAFQTRELDLIDRTAELEDKFGTMQTAIKLRRRALNGYDTLTHSPAYVPSEHLLKARNRVFSSTVELLEELDLDGEELEEQRNNLRQRLQSQISEADLLAFQKITHQILRHKIVSKSAATEFVELVSKHKSQTQHLIDSHPEHAMAQKALKDLLGLLQNFERLFNEIASDSLKATDVDAEFLEGGTFPAEVLFRIRVDQGKPEEFEPIGDAFYEWAQKNPSFAFAAAKHLGYLEQSIGSTLALDEKIANLLRVANEAKQFDIPLLFDNLICDSSELAVFRSADLGQKCILEIAKVKGQEFEADRDLAGLSRLSQGLATVTNPGSDLINFAAHVLDVLNRAMQAEATRQNWKLSE